MAGEDEYLFAPYSAFKVVNATWRAGTADQPHEVDLYAAIGAMSCLYWVPQKSNEIRPAARWRLARRARWLAGRARASSQSQIYA